MAQHGTLGPPGGAGCIEDRRNIIQAPDFDRAITIRYAVHGIHQRTTLFQTQTQGMGYIVICGDLSKRIQRFRSAHQHMRFGIGYKIIQFSRRIGGV